VAPDTRVQSPKWISSCGQPASFSKIPHYHLLSDLIIWPYPVLFTNTQWALSWWQEFSLFTQNHGSFMEAAKGTMPFIMPAHCMAGCGNVCIFLHLQILCTCRKHQILGIRMVFSAQSCTTRC